MVSSLGRTTVEQKGSNTGGKTRPILTLNTLGKIFSRRHFKILFLFSPGNRIWHFKSCFFYCRQIAWNVKTCFLEKKVFQDVVCCKMFTQSAKRSPIRCAYNADHQSFITVSSRNFDTLKSHFCIVKQGFTGVYIILLLLKKHRLWVLVRTDSPRRFQRVPTRYVFEQN